MASAVEFEIETDDHRKITATKFMNERPGAHLIILAPAAAAPQHYYAAFASYACEHKDFDVVTFDYRGIGKSSHHKVTEDTATMSDWGQQDLNAVIRWADKKYDKICLIGHSVAGQVFPKASEHRRIHAAYFVGSQSAYHGHWKGIWWIYVLIFWYVLLPLTTMIYRYLPGWTTGGNVPIPKKAAGEWRKWGTHPRGVLLGRRDIEALFEDVRIPIHFVSIQDDKLLAPPAATQSLMHEYKNAVTSFQFIRPDDLSLKKIGHFGFFKKKFKKQLWPMPLLFFAQYVNKLEGS